MKLSRCFLVVLVLALLVADLVPAQSRKHKPKKPIPAPLPVTETTALYELLQRTQRAAEQAQEEARRAREQNTELQQRLVQNTEELARLRQAVAALGVQVAEGKVEPSRPPAPAPPAAPVAPAISQTEFDTLKEQVEVNTAQLKEHSQTKVESDSKMRVKLHGMILANTFLNTNDSSQNDVPLFAPVPAAAVRKNNLGASLRQTQIGFTFEGPRLSEKLGAARLSAEADFDFWGGDASEVLGTLRILTASARLDWERTSFIVGQRQPLISPRNPSSLAATWFAPLAAAGNLWQWRPQLMLEHRLRTGDGSELQLQGGLLIPFGGTLQGEVIEGGPGYEARIVSSHSLASENKLEFGFGGYHHRRSFSFGRQVTSYALTGDWQIPLSNRLTLTGEAYAGRAISLGEPSGFRNDRLYAVTGPITSPTTKIRGVYSVGGWAQLNYRVHPTLDFNFAYGQDDPRNRDLFSGQITSATRLKNQAASANFIWALRQNFLVSLEYRRLWTAYPATRQRAGHYNLAFGYTF
ncbi:MAG: hypothetical protein U0Y68_05340 [Blastocatellia bacterium]